MVVKLEMCFEIDDESLDEIKKLEHHADYLLNLAEYPEIKSVYALKVTEVIT